MGTRLAWKGIKSGGKQNYFQFPMLSFEHRNYWDSVL